MVSSPSPSPAWLEELKQLLGADAVLSQPEDLLVYESDSLTLRRHAPQAIVFPRSTEDVQRIVRTCVKHGVPFLPRGAGTGISGGAVAVRGGVLIECARMKRILEIDLENRFAVVEPGVVNLDLTRAVSAAGFHYAPDPSSQSTCTIGGNVAENSGGPHCLKYGATTQHVIGVEVVLPTGDVVRFGGPVIDSPGYDLTGVFVGSEGTMGIATRIWVKLTPLPQIVRTMLASFRTMDASANAVSDIIAAGILPAAMEILDRMTIQVIEASVYRAGYPTDADAVLLVEVDGAAAGIERAVSSIVTILKARAAIAIEVARDEEARQRLWGGRKSAFGVMGRMNTDIYVLDGVVPRSRLPEALRRVTAVGARHGFEVSNVFHAGDGNLHPILTFDGRKAEDRERAMRAGEEILRVCVELGGAITGEHGVGLEKNEFMPWTFDEHDLAVMKSVRDIFNPADLCNPGKVFPTPRCIEAKGTSIPSTPPTRRAPSLATGGRQP
ncbi:MAG: FAD-binding protein [Planctomycetes bacterium]|nr:FAD-binding protein [Planctomycetota bacterium]MBI3848480.1 FAD-binding protein [Planctomycetota bacterium]